MAVWLSRAAITSARSGRLATVTGKVGKSSGRGSSTVEYACLLAIAWGATLPREADDRESALEKVGRQLSAPLYPALDAGVEVGPQAGLVPPALGPGEAGMPCLDLAHRARPLERGPVLRHRLGALARVALARVRRGRDLVLARRPPRAASRLSCLCLAWDLLPPVTGAPYWAPWDPCYPRR